MQHAINSFKFFSTLLLLLLANILFSPVVQAHPHECYSVEYADHYVVKPGDTYFIIAQKFYGDGYLWNIVYQANLQYRPRYIPVGVILHIPAIQVSHVDCHQTQDEMPLPPVQQPPQQPTSEPLSTPVPVASPTPVMVPTPAPTISPIASPTPLPTVPQSREILKQEAFASQINLFYQPSFYSEQLQSKSIQTNGQVANGFGARLRVLPHENVMISGQYQRSFNILERQGTKEQTERLHQQANLGISYVAPLPIEKSARKDKSLSFKLGVNARYHHYQGKTIENELSPLRDRDYMDGQFQTFSGELEAGMAYRYTGYQEPITLEGNIGYSPYQVVIQDPVQNYGLPEHMQSLKLELSVISKIPDTDANIGLHYQYNYGFGEQFQQSQHQINMLTGYEF